MKNNKRIYVITITSFLTVLITAFIFGNSMQTGEESGALSDIFVRLVINPLDFLGINANVDTVGFIVRKVAHFSEYFVLSGSFSIDLICIFKKRIFSVIAPIYATVIAFFDEFLVQSATEGRSPEIRDVLIDCSGAFLAFILILLIYNYKQNKNREF